MWATNSRELCKESTLSTLRKFIKETTQILKRTKSHEKLINEADEAKRVSDFLIARAKRTSEAKQIERPTNVPSRATYLIPLDLLREAGPGYRIGTISINGALFHAEAMEVTYKNGIQEGVTPEAQELLEDLPYRDGAFETVEWNNTVFVLHIHPHAR